MNQNLPILMRSQRASATTNRLGGEFGMAPAWQLAAGASPARNPIVPKHLNRVLNLDKPLPAVGGIVAARPSWPWLEFLRKIPVKAYNAVFTPMGRKNFSCFVKKSLVRMNPQFRAQGALVYPLNDGQPFVLHADNRLSELFYLERAYEPLEVMMLSKLVQPGDVALDLGANVGFYTAQLNRLVQPGGEVHAFEPGEGTFAKLEQTKKLLRLERAVLHQQAIGETVGEADFWSSNCGNDAAQKSTHTPAFARELRHHRVPLTTVDALAAELGESRAGKIAFVKCDIEGAEPAMLRGAKKLLDSENPPVWLMEHNREALVEHGTSSADLVKFFSGCDIYFVPLCWPPSLMSVPQARKWNGVPNELPDECNLIVLPTRGIFSKRAEALHQSGLLA
jgi:FkbM family methyltransferase